MMDRPCARDSDPDIGDFRKKLRDAQSNQLVFAIVGQAGSGTSKVARQLKSAWNMLGDFQQIQTKNRPNFHADIVKASKVIRDQRNESCDNALNGTKKIDDVEGLQDDGDDLRKTDNCKIGQLILGEIIKRRSTKAGSKINVWIIDALRHPSEVRLFRSIYGDSFFLVGVVCSHEERRRRLSHKFPGALPEAIDNFMSRDEGDEGNSAGQQVAKAFKLADVFVDNTDVNESSDQPNAGWRVPEDLRRFVDLILQSKIIPPTMEETAMYAAYGAAMRSACLSRQVGAALADEEGRLIATGCNDVPKPGGGLYGQGLVDAQVADHRCFAFAGKDAYCRNNREQQEMIIDIAEKLIIRFSSYFSSDRESSTAKREALIKELQNSRITTLTEFSRAVHAEMDALLATARQGISPVGASLFVTTFPCHNCAGHIVAAGVREVQYIELYRKSQATKLHEDAITISPREAKGGAKVLFRPFTGVAPRRYRQFFFNERDLKDDMYGDRYRQIAPPPWGRPGQQIEASQKVAEEFATGKRNGKDNQKNRKPRKHSGNGKAKNPRPGTNGSSDDAPQPAS